MRNTKPIRKTTPYELSELHEVGDPGLEVDLDCRTSCVRLRRRTEGASLTIKLLVHARLPDLD